MIVRSLRYAALVLFAFAMATAAGCKEDPSGGPAELLCDSDEDCEAGACVDGVCEEQLTDVSEDLEDDGEEDSDGESDTGDSDDTEDSETIDDPCEGDTNLPFECPCEGDDECASGRCFRNIDQNVCSKQCGSDADCGNTEEYQCITPDGGNDTVNLCVPVLAELCTACTDDSECTSSSTCFAFPDNSNCLIACDDESDCPDEFSCQTTEGEQTHCYPDLQTCSGCYDPDDDGAGDGEDCIATDCDQNNPSVFEGAEELCDGVDNDCDEAVDEGFLNQETEVYDTTEFCGSCSNDCNAKPEVVEGSCSAQGECGAVVECNEGYYDLDGDGSNGCEYACTPKPDATDDSICDGEDDDCDGEIDEDVDFASDDQNCRSCGNVCGSAGVGGGSETTCVDSECILESCNAPYEDCNEDPSDFCEANLQSPQNCGGCGVLCSDNNTDSEPACEANSEGEGEFSCVFDCSENFDDCDGEPGNGCEANLMNDADNCGGCGITCDYANGEGICVNGTCQLDTCQPGFDDCNGDGSEIPENSDGCESDLSTVDTCGACGTTCDDAGADEDPICTGNVDDGFECELDCINNETEDCDGDPNNGCETSIDSDVANCGACGASCELPNAIATCQNQLCFYGGCQPQYGDCDQSLPAQFGTPATVAGNNGCEVNTVDDVDNCGGCGNLSPQQYDCDYNGGDWRCEQTTCIADQCAFPTANCNGNPSTCEANLGDVETCGSCQVSCNNPPEASGDAQLSATSCNPNAGSFSCSIDSCNTGYGNCDSTWSNGCEVDFSADTTCGEACGELIDCTDALDDATGECGANNTCEVASCDDPYADCNDVDSDGCETNTDTSVPNCGGCGIVCEIDNAVTQCTDGGCEFVRCEDGYYDIDNSLVNGCEYQCDGNPNSYDRPDSNFEDADCDGFDGDLGRAIYVSINGTNNSTCDRDNPCRDISHALQRASALGKQQILVGNTSGGQIYNERINLVNGIDIIGGYPEDNFDSRDLGVQPKIRSTSSVGGRVIAVSGANLLSTTLLYQLDIEAGDAPAGVSGASSYGIHCINCGGLQVESSTVRSGDGSDGDNGASGSDTGASGGEGAVGGKGDNDGGSGGAGGQGGASACGRDGGRGGSGSKGSGESGDAGQVPGAGGGTGGAGGSQSDPGNPGNPGGPGDSGDQGSGGDSGNIVTVNSSGFWQGEGGGNGTRGTNGHGGGGGGGGGGQSCGFCDDGAGAGGGGGGGAGCAGSAGFGGNAGGGSFALFILDSQGTTLTDIALHAGNGGDGGNGGNGASGGQGGGGGGGGVTDEVGNGGSGGEGGDGGRGGGGGGGRGGDVVCLATNGGTSVQSTGVNCDSLGTAGSGGAGGNNAPDGQGGVRRSTEEY